MNMVIARSLHVIEGILLEAKDSLEMKFKAEELMTKELIGLPYYWGEYSGIIEPVASQPRKVVTHVFNEITGEECRWTFDSVKVFNHLKTIQEYHTWSEYNMAQRLGFAEEFESLLIKYHYTQKELEEKMKEYCKKHNVSYKSYLQL